ncbi:hypothetical protein [Pedobacter psychrodurus]|uniref:hypothetical protein n=1 Tax=Pedobacter psychrodurus TaxID=2530456 RepID=UPI002931E732|nr:hypothetical protein [Pedobacter psychrodurus]
MKKFLLNLSVFLLISIITYIVLIIAFGSFMPKGINKNLPYSFGGHIQNRLKEVSHYTNVDVLILGSSHAYRGYDVRKFRAKGLSAFNLGTSAQTPIQTEFLFNKYINILKPKFVIMDIYPAVLGSDGVESSVDLLTNLNFDKNLFSLMLKVNEIKVYNTAIFSLYNQITGKNKNYVTTDSLGGGDTYVKGGFVESFKTATFRNTYPAGKYDISPTQIKAFENIINELKRRKIRYVLVQAPIPTLRYKSFNNTKDIDQLLSHYGKYYNFNNSLDLSSEFFIDDSHLNQKGVNIFNKKLLDTLGL